MKISIFLFTILVFTISSNAQSSKRQHFFVQNRHFVGTPIIYSDSLNSEDLDNSFYATDIRFGVQANGERKFDQFLGFQQYGLGIFHFNLNNPILGNPWAIYAFFDAPIYQFGKFHLDYDLGFGVGFNFNEYDAETNPKNDVIGSDINAFFTGGIRATYRISKRFATDAGVEFMHFSNGTLKTPNKGLNMYAAHIGLSYFFALPKQDIYTPAEMLRKTIPKIKRYNEFTFNYSIGGKSTLGDYGDGPNYLMSSFIVDYYRNYHHIAKAGVGIDYIYDGTYETDYSEPQSFDKYSFIGVHIGHELIVSKFTFVGHIGTYIWKGTEGKGHFYFRVGLRYYVCDNIFANITLKTENGFRADFIEFGLGYKLSFKK